jgi:hypothetical protein
MSVAQLLSHLFPAVLPSAVATIMFCLGLTWREIPSAALSAGPAAILLNLVGAAAALGVAHVFPLTPSD